ncbi:MAG: GntG family PLP-dependent aldolase [Pseudomonadota bacterium]
MQYIDLRSDTVTKPCDNMRKALANANVGDDVFGDDPTVIKLQKMTAEILGKEAALYVPSGTMGNLICLKTLSSHGDEVICERFSHIVNYEVAGLSSIAGLMTNMLDGDHGILYKDQIKKVLRKKDLHTPGTKIVSLENTHNRAGGIIFPLQEIKNIKSLCEENNIYLHLDGARLWNAHVATGISLEEYASCADTVSVCFSKGLGAPIGSCIAGSKDFIERAKRVRKMLGGGLRQAGILANAAIFALVNNIDRLRNDHENAQIIAKGVSEIPGVSIDLDYVQTNIVIFDVKKTGKTAVEVCQKWQEAGVLTLPISDHQVRAVTNLMVSQEACLQAAEAFKKIF